MPSIVSNVLFSEPSGRLNALVQFGGALVFLALFAYAWIRGSADTSYWILFMVVGATLSGIAESLPKQRRRAAGVFRLTAICVLLSLLATTIFAPEFIVGHL